MSIRVVGQATSFYSPEDVAKKALALIGKSQPDSFSKKSRSGKLTMHIIPYGVGPVFDELRIDAPWPVMSYEDAWVVAHEVCHYIQFGYDPQTTVAMPAWYLELQAESFAAHLQCSVGIPLSSEQIINSAAYVGHFIKSDQPWGHFLQPSRLNIIARDCSLIKPAVMKWISAPLSNPSFFKIVEPPNQADLVTHVFQKIDLGSVPQQRGMVCLNATKIKEKSSREKRLILTSKKTKHK